ncbi:hypothetical protein Q1695_005716 [Nippostrongylus brasiliensis]|nr:hypothetical protein Q1695_005716 [Nippostrongylus brasiliensis]
MPAINEHYNSRVEKPKTVKFLAYGNRINSSAQFPFLAEAPPFEPPFPLPPPAFGPELFPPQPFPQPFNIFGPGPQQQPLQQLQPQATTQVSTTQRIENIPNPDREQGVWAVPDPRSWPRGPDWNDPRNNWEGVKGWTSDGNSVTNSRR